MATASPSPVEKGPLHDWIDVETRPIDVVASWETLCDVYRALEFSDPLSDTVRLEEFKWIVREMNKHLTRSRKQLMSCRNFESARTVLSSMFTPTGNVNVSGRRELAYQKLRQRWVVQMLGILDQLEQDEKTKEAIADGDGYDW